MLGRTAEIEQVGGLRDESGIRPGRGKFVLQSEHYPVDLRSRDPVHTSNFFLSRCQSLFTLSWISSICTCER